MVIGGENRHGDPSSNPGGGCLHLQCADTLEKGMNPTIFPQGWVNSRPDKSL